MKRILVILTIISAIILLSQFVSPHIFADALSAAKDQACSGANLAGADCSATNASNGVSTLIKAVINILSIIIGIAAVIVIILSGLKYITSGGDSNGVSNAKNTLTYALVGLAVAALAQILVNFVLFQVAPHPCPYNSKIDTASSLCVPPAKKK